MAERSRIDWTRSRDIRFILKDQFPEWYYIADARDPFHGHILQNVMNAVDGLRMSEENDERRSRLFQIEEGLRQNGIGKFMLDWGAKNAREGRPAFDKELVETLKVIRASTARPVGSHLSNVDISSALVTLYDTSYFQTMRQMGKKPLPAPARQSPVPTRP